MTALATFEQINAEAKASTNGSVPATRAQAVSPLELTYQQLWEFSTTVAESGMFKGIDTPSKAMTLMMLSQCDRIHPVLALKRYHIIEGRPSLKAQTLDAEFLARGGKRVILRCDAEEARAIYSHPRLHPEPIEMAVTWEECQNTYAVGEKGTKNNWKNSRADMLWARLVAKGSRRIDPGIETGIPTCEELEDILSWENPSPFQPIEPAAKPPAQALAHVGPLPPAQGDVVVPGGPESAFDPRPVHLIIQGTCDKVGIDFADALSTLRNRAMQLGLWTKPVPTKRSAVIEMLGTIYKTDRDWMRTEIAALTKPTAPPAASPPPAPDPAPPPAAAAAPPNGCPLKTGLALQEWARATGLGEGVDLLAYLSRWGGEAGYKSSIKHWSAAEVERGYRECHRHLEERANGVPY